MVKSSRMRGVAKNLLSCTLTAFPYRYFKDISKKTNYCENDLEIMDFVSVKQVIRVIYHSSCHKMDVINSKPQPV